MEIILATTNPSKVEQIALILNSSSHNVISMHKAGVIGEAVEDGTTLEQNAFKKAIFAWQQTKTWCMADDTGIFIDALDGLPGINAARWAGEVSTEAIMQHTLTQLVGVRSDERTATFKTSAVVITPSGDSVTFTGELRGSILMEAKVPCQPKMPYSAIFQPHGHSKVWAEMTTEEENEISHRGQAFAQVRTFLEQRSTSSSET